MQIDWAHLKTAIEHGITAAKKEHRGGVRIHCDAAERMLKKAAKRDGTAKEIVDHVHHAKTSLDLDRATEFLEKALALVPAGS